LLPLLQCLDFSQRLYTEERERFHMVQFARKSAVTLQCIALKYVSVCCIRVRKAYLKHVPYTLTSIGVHCFKCRDQS